MKWHFNGTQSRRTQADFIRFLSLNAPPPLYGTGATENPHWLIGKTLVSCSKDYGTAVKTYDRSFFDKNYKAWSKHKTVKK